jgi:hypothetical protein
MIEETSGHGLMTGFCQMVVDRGFNAIFTYIREDRELARDGMFDTMIC